MLIVQPYDECLIRNTERSQIAIWQQSKRRRTWLLCWFFQSILRSGLIEFFLIETIVVLGAQLFSILPLVGFVILRLVVPRIRPPQVALALEHIPSPTPQFVTELAFFWQGVEGTRRCRRLDAFWGLETSFSVRHGDVYVFNKPISGSTLWFNYYSKVGLIKVRFAVLGSPPRESEIAQTRKDLRRFQKHLLKYAKVPMFESELTQWTRAQKPEGIFVLPPIIPNAIGIMKLGLWRVVLCVAGPLFGWLTYSFLVTGKGLTYLFLAVTLVAYSGYQVVRTRKVFATMRKAGNQLPPNQANPLQE